MKIMNKIQLYKFRGIAFIVLLTVLQSCAKPDFKEADAVVRKIEQYKKAHSKLPISLSDIGMDHLSGPVFYDKLEGAHYQMFYKDQSGDVWIYSTFDKNWNYCSECEPMFIND